MRNRAFVVMSDLGHLRESAELRVRCSVLLSVEGISNIGEMNVIHCGISMSILKTYLHVQLFPNAGIFF